MLGNAHRQPGISGLRYRIEAQKPFGTQDPAGQVQIHATPMQLQYRVRHEESFSSIQKRISSAIGHAVMRRCQITRLPPAESTGLAVDCDYLWLNLASASGTAKEAQ